MANHEQPYDPYIPSGRGTPGPTAQHDGNDRTAALQAQIDDTVNVMRQNIQRTEERGGHLDNIEYTSQKIGKKMPDSFKRGANRKLKEY
ncbi:Vesicle membrane receptor protein (v-SNARE) [Xanthoria parietina]